MKTLSITNAKRGFRKLLESRGPVTITGNGEPLAVLSVRYTVKPASSPERVADAARRARVLLANSPTVTDPDQGITAELRRLRDLGESTN